ncbi:hypothetical protein MMC07_006765 [Pseudocyphellaria aurata]|nr:hypothetical protein [Pseudocyphellaria aurata]
MDPGEPMEICPPSLPSLAHYPGKLYPGAWVCNSALCPIKFPHTVGLFMLDGKAPQARDIMVFGGSNPPKFCWDAYDRCCAGTGTLEDVRTVQIFRDLHGQVNTALWYAQGHIWMEQLERRKYESQILNHKVPQLNSGRGEAVTTTKVDIREAPEAAHTEVVTPGTRAVAIKKTTTTLKATVTEAPEAAQTRGVTSGTRAAAIKKTSTTPKATVMEAPEAAQTGVVASGTRTAIIKETGTTPKTTAKRAPEAVLKRKLSTEKSGTRKATIEKVNPVADAEVMEVVMEVATGIEAEESRTTDTVSFQTSSQSHSPRSASTHITG